MSGSGKPRNALTIDVEDYFQVSAFDAHIARAQWAAQPCRVERNVDLILALLKTHQARATFFTLGWIAERYPALVRRIVDGGHELASHAYAHLRACPTRPVSPRPPTGESGLLELPISTVRVLGRNMPAGGGGYFRLLPYAASRWALRRINSHDGQAGIFYFHPWELDPGQPRPAGIGIKTRFRHYLNLHRMEHRITRLLGDFRWGRIDDIFLGTA